MNLKFNALKIAEIEKTFNKPIEEIVTDTKLETIAIFVAKGFTDEDGKTGCSKDVAYDKITEYLKEHENGKTSLICDVIEELCDEGFLPKEMKEMRAIAEKQMTQAQEQIAKMKA